MKTTAHALDDHFTSIIPFKDRLIGTDSNGQMWCGTLSFNMDFYPSEAGPTIMWAKIKHFEIDSGVKTDLST